MDINPDDFLQQNQSSVDERLLVRFLIKPRQDAAATAKAGRPIFKDVEYIDIKIPGDRAGGVCRPAKPRDIARFQRHYDAFKARNEEVVVEGTPLAEWAQITRSQAEELGYFHIKTVEQLADLSDAHAQNFMGIQALKRKAKEWLAENDKLMAEQAMNEKLQKALNEKDAEMRTMQESIAEMERRIQELVQAKKPARKPRAKPKDVA